MRHRLLAGISLVALLAWGPSASAATTTFGFQANHTGNTTPPTGFTLNTTTCTSS